jgi:hypothetical protein
LQVRQAPLGFCLRAVDHVGSSLCCQLLIPQQRRHLVAGASVCVCYVVYVTWCCSQSLIVCAQLNPLTTHVFR